MALEWDIDPGTGISRLEAEGVVSVEETLRVLGELYADSRHGSPTRILWDMRRITAVWTTEEAHRVLGFAQTHRPPGGGRNAIVADRDFAFGVGRMIATHSEDMPFEIRVFRDYDSAVDWLGRIRDSRRSTSMSSRRGAGLRMLMD